MRIARRDLCRDLLLVFHLCGDLLLQRVRRVGHIPLRLCGALRVSSVGGVRVRLCGGKGVLVRLNSLIYPLQRLGVFSDVARLQGLLRAVVRVRNGGIQRRQPLLRLDCPRLALATFSRFP